MLNESQKKAVETIQGPLLIIAGPGSGKTRTLVERMAYMIQQKNINPKEILVSTFTERASREITTRIANKLKGNINFHLEGLYIGTLHSICLKIIDSNIEHSNLKKGYKVLDDFDQRFFIFSKFKEFKNLKNYSEYMKDKQYTSSWGQIRNIVKWFNKFSEEGLNYLNEDFLPKAYELYKKLLFEDNVIDFAMIQCEAFRILSESEVALNLFREQIKYIMIDEYQDTNTIQEKLIFLIGGDEQNICVVGDDDQSIYRFRGATIKNILHFPEKIGEKCQIVKLETNYRSEKDIVKFCKRWMESLRWDDFRYYKELIVPEEKNIERTRVVKLSVEESEFRWYERIGKFLKFLKSTKKIQDYNQVAFLFRSVKNKSVISLGHYLEKEGIEVYSPRANQFFMREEIKLIVGIFLYVLRRKNSRIYIESFIRENKKLIDYYKSCLTMVEKKLVRDEKFSQELSDLKKEYENIYQNGMKNLLSLYYKIISINYFKNIFELKFFEKNESVLDNRELYNLGIFSKIIEKVESLSKISDITEENIVKVGDYFFTMHLKYLKDSGVDEYEDIREYAPSGAVSFLTIHQSKGLEFPVVIVGSLDSVPDYENDEDLENERKYIPYSDFEPEDRKKDFDFWRLYYTAFSRAKNLLVLTCVEINKDKNRVPSLPFVHVYESIPDISKGLSIKDLQIENTNKIELKDSFSYTADLLKYNECPYRYRLNKKFEFFRNKIVGNFYGILVHETLEFINREIMHENILDEEKISEEYYRNYQLLKKSENTILNSEIVKIGLEQVLNYFKSDYTKNKIIGVEKQLFSMKENYTLEGNLDCIVEEENGLKIIDFKTGSEEISEETLEKYISQIKFYCYLLGINSNKKIIGGEIYFVKTQKKIEVCYEVGSEKNILDEFDVLAENISNGNFSEKNLSKEICLNCEFKYHCKIEI